MSIYDNLNDNRSIGEKKISIFDKNIGILPDNNVKEPADLIEQKLNLKNFDPIDSYMDTLIELIFDQPIFTDSNMDRLIKVFIKAQQKYNRNIQKAKAKSINIDPALINITNIFCNAIMEYKFSILQKERSKEPKANISGSIYIIHEAIAEIEKEIKFISIK